MGCFFPCVLLEHEFNFFEVERIVETISSKVAKCFVLGQSLQTTFCSFLL